MSLFVVLIALTAMSANLEEIKLPLKDATCKAAFEGGDDLVGYNDGEEKLFFYTNGFAEFKARLPSEGQYTLTLNASCQAAEKEHARIDIEVDGKSISKNFSLTTEDAKDYTFTIKGKEGDCKIKVIFTNDKYKEGEYDLNFYIHGASLKKK